MKTVSRMFGVHCRQCHRDGPAGIVTGHLDGKAVTCCSFCNSTNVKIISIDAPNGERLERAHVIAGKLRLG